MRHETAVRIGSGGMGEVFKAWDPDLERHVALKYLMSSDPELALRLLREARAQAKLDHPNICRIFEVGTEDDGRPYLVMEYIDGEPLDVAAADMCLEEKVEVLRAVALAVHHAHSHGVIHRDLKPGNILVAKEEDGGHRPYLVDFGLARADDGTALTRTGAVMGTPEFMAPEQVRGDIRRIDRRTDVYALGAVLYSLLAGAPPFSAESTPALFMQILDAEAPPLGRIDATIPKDLQVIAETCLEKEPQHRYRTALEVAEDLNRWLKGEPITARSVGWPTRTWRRARRHPVISSAATLAVVAVVIAAGVAVHARMTATEQARLARDFASAQERLAATLRHVHMLPMHDSSGIVETLRARMGAMAEEIDRRGAVARGPGSASLGHLHLAFGDLSAARKHLTEAREAGWDRPQVRTDLGTVLARLYEQRLSAARAVREPDVRAALIETAQDELRDPALELLGDLSDEVESGDLVRSLVARLEERWDDAIDHASRAREAAPWLYEADLRRGEALLGRAQHNIFNGDVDTGLADMELAGAAFASAADVGRSDPRVYLAECDRLNRMLEREVSRAGAFAGGVYERAVEACGAALTTDPKNGPAHRFLALIAVRKASEAWWNRGEDPTPDLTIALEHSTRAVELDPDSAETHNAAGVAWMIQGRYQSAEGVDPTASLDRATGFFAEAARLDPALPSAAINATVCSVELGRWAEDHGADGEDHYRRGLGHIDRVLELHPHSVRAMTTKAVVHLSLAEILFGRGIDPSEELELSIATSRQAQEKAPHSPSIVVNLGVALWLLGDWQYLADEDPSASLQEARSTFERALELRPDSVSAWINLCGVWVSEVRYLMDHGQDPTTALEQARMRVDGARERYPDEFYVDLGEVELLVGRWEAMQKRSPERHLDAAERVLSDGIKRYPGRPKLYRMMADVELTRALWLAGHPAAAKKAVMAGIDMADRALALDPDLGEAIAVRGALKAVMAEVEPGDPEIARGAAADLERAIEINPMLHRKYADTLDRARSLVGSPESL